MSNDQKIIAPRVLLEQFLACDREQLRALLDAPDPVWNPHPDVANLASLLIALAQYGIKITGGKGDEPWCVETASQPQGEPVAYRIGVNGEWFYGDKLSCIRERVEYESTFTEEDFEEAGVVTPEPLYTEQPAPVAVVLPERREPTQDNPYLSDGDHEWNAYRDELKRLNPSL